jgi:hypothetical protein
MANTNESGGWIEVYTTKDLYLAEMAKQMLQDHSIEAIVLNKLDSSYITIGHIEVLVKGENQHEAELLLKEFGS